MQMYTGCLRANRVITQHPPDHWIGYLVAISGALMQMMSYGIDNSFSIFSSDMQNDPTLGYPSATTVSYGNSVSLGLSPVFGIFAGFLVDRVPPRLMMFISTVLLFAGLWISSTYAKSSVAVSCSYCLMASISSAFMLSPGAAATSSWFRKRLGLAQGINFCGGGIGSAFIPSVLGSWVEPYGWRRSFQLTSAFCSIGLVGTILSCRREPMEDEDAVTPVTALPVEPITDHRPQSVQSLELEKKKPDQPAKMPDATAISQTSMAENADVLSPSSQGSDSEVAQITGWRFLFNELHSRKLTWREVPHVYLSPPFLSHFFMFAVFGWAFYGLIYIAVPYVSSMGKEGTVYASVEPISTSKASTVMTFWGSFQIVGSVLVGGMASFTADAFAYSVCSAIGGIACALLLFCRSYAAFVVCWSVVGFCTAGMFAMMPALIAKDFYGPNLGFLMASVFLAGCLGGFSAPPIQAQLQTRYEGNYSYGCVFISCCMTFPGVLCYLMLWPEKQSRLGKRMAALTRWNS